MHAKMIANLIVAQNAATNGLAEATKVASEIISRRFTFSIKSQIPVIIGVIVM